MGGCGTAAVTPDLNSAPEGHFAVVVVGSGFGGSVMTQRLSEAGIRVCLLERGKAYPLGSLPRSTVGDGPKLLGSKRGATRDLQRLVVPRHRRHRRERPRRRSEEHTSELQSREKLVC